MFETEKLEDNGCTYYLAVYVQPGSISAVTSHISLWYECMACCCGELTGKGKSVLSLASCKTPGKQLCFCLVSSEMGMVRVHTGRTQKSQPSV